MPNFYYHNASGQKIGPVNELQLKTLATQGVINSQTPLETDTGHKGQAGQIPGLFPAPAPANPVQPVMQQQTYESAHIVIHQPSKQVLWLWFINYGVFINGVPAGTFIQQQTVKLSVPVGQFQLKINTDASTLVEIMAGQEKKFILRFARGFWWKFGVLGVIGFFLFDTCSLTEVI